MPVLDPFVVDAWLRATLLDTVGHTATVNGVVEPADVPALVGDRIAPLREDFTPSGWPYILIANQRDQRFDNYAEANVLADDEVAVYMVMLQSELAGAGWAGDIEDFTRRGYIAISEALQGVRSHTAGGLGVVHGCEVIRPWKRLYGEPGERVSEMGVVVRIYST